MSLNQITDAKFTNKTSVIYNKQNVKIIFNLFNKLLKVKLFCN